MFWIFRADLAEVDGDLLLVAVLFRGRGSISRRKVDSIGAEPWQSFPQNDVSLFFQEWPASRESFVPAASWGNLAGWMLEVELGG